MEWDAKPVQQSHRKALYDQAIERLTASGDAFRCTCSRKAIAELAATVDGNPIYPGTCRRKPPAAESRCALRMTVPTDSIAFTDRVGGRIVQNLAREVGDFVIRRLDGYTAYQLAVVVDDDEQGISDVVRGADLLWSTPRQIWLQQRLGMRTPRYAHIPLVEDSHGRKLSKRDHDRPLDEGDPLPGLRAAWQHLAQPQPPDTIHDVADFWSWAIPRWDITRISSNRILNNERAHTV
jgi:glutamyl-Q tRNA(Asp) synthetase